MAFNRNRDSRTGGGGGGFRSRPSFGARPSFGDRDRGSRGPVEMHKAICDNCGRECEVPFRPTSGKPVYCSNCFESKREGGGDSRRFDERPRFEKPQRSEQQSQPQPNYGQQLDALNAKVDKILDILSSAIEEEEEEEEVETVTQDEAPVETPAKPAKKSKKKEVVVESPQEQTTEEQS